MTRIRGRLRRPWLAIVATLGLLATGARAQSGLDKLVSLKAREQDLSKVMSLLAQNAGVNILVAPTEAKRKVTIDLRNVPGRKAMELIAKLNRLQVRDVEGDEKVWVVAAKQIFEEEFDQGLTEPVPLKFAAAAKMAQILQKALSKAGNITIEVDERTNTLVVSGTKDLITRTKELINRLDKPVPQVLIDSKIVSVQTNVLKDIGFNWDWGTGFNNMDGDQMVQDAGGSGPLLTFSERHRINNNEPFFQGTNAGGAEVLRFGDFYRGNLFFDAVFRALETNSIARSLASPRLLAVNGAKAQLRIGDEVVFSGGPSQGPESKETGLILDVEPRINKDGFITLDVQIEQSTARS
jgi:type IV pilus assembly protein PilQ